MNKYDNQKTSVSRIASLIKEIDEKSEGYRRITKKMRDDVERIFNVFGEPGLCQICDDANESGAHHLYEAYDGRWSPGGIHWYFDNVEEHEKKLKDVTLKVKPEGETRWGIYPGYSEAGKKSTIFYWAHKPEDIHKFTPKIALPIIVVAPEPFKTESNEPYANYVDEYKLAIDKESHMYVSKESVNVGVGPSRYKIENLSNHTIKEMLNKNAILEFFDYIIKELQEQNKTYTEVSNVSTKLRSGLEQ